VFHAVEFALALQNVCDFFVACASFNFDAVLCGHEVVDVYTAAFDACKFLWPCYQREAFVHDVDDDAFIAAFSAGVFNAYSAYFYSGHVFVSPKEAITANREYKDNMVAGLFFLTWKLVRIGLGSLCRYGDF
jgi:hypothetical protein